MSLELKERPSALSVDLSADFTAAIPRHPADPNVAYGYNLDPVLMTKLVRGRVLTAAIIRQAIPQDEIRQLASPNVQKAFREACAHFTGFFVSREKGHFNIDLEHGIAVMRGLGMPRQGFDIETPGFYEGGKSLLDFLPDGKLAEHIKKCGENVAVPFKGYGYHIFHAFAQKAKDGYYSAWHTHEDIGTHVTLAGATLEWLPSFVNAKDLATAPDRYETMTQRTSIGDMAIIGRLIHRSSHNIPEEGQFAFITHGPYEPSGGN